MARIKDVLKNEEDEQEEETKQLQHEASSNKPHWRKIKKKPGPKNKEEDDSLKERFPDGQVSCNSSMINEFLSCFFPVSAVSKKDHAS